MATDTLSPVARSVRRSKRFTEERSIRLKSKLVPWCAVLSFLCFEIFVLHGSIGSFAFGFFPQMAVMMIEYAMFTYVLTMILWMLAMLVWPSSKRITSLSADVASPVSFNDKSFCMQSTPLPSSSRANRSDTSWVEDHRFGSANTSLMNTSNGKSSGVGSPVSGDVLPALMTSVRTKSSPYSKPVDSIHTREQLDRLLRKDSESSFVDVSSSSLKNSSFSFFNILNLSSGGERKGYKLSEQPPQDNKENNVSVAHFDSDGRVHLSPAGTVDDVDELSKLRTAILNAKQTPRKISGSPMLRRTDSAMERRRRSHSSPDRQLSSSMLLGGEGESSGDLDEVSLARGEYRLRAWTVNTILKPLMDQIAKINVKLDKEHANPPLRIGVSSVDALKTALSSRETLRATLLPYILRYLSAHTSQAYLISRIAELSADTFMTAYNWNSGGFEPLEERNSSGRVSRKAWHDGLPTDAELIFSLFCSYMDGRMTSNPLVGSISLDQPFTALFTLKAPNKPSAVLCASGSMYIHMASAVPPHFELVTVTDGTRIAIKTPVAKGASNLFYTILQFVHRAKVNGGKIDMLSIGPSGLGIESILD